MDEAVQATEVWSPHGELVAGKYRLIARLATGGQADVFLAVVQSSVGFNKLSVIKRLREPLAAQEDLRQQFLDEARLTARLSHPNIVHTHDVGLFRDAYFIAMEYLEGQSLNMVSRALQGKFSHATWARVICEVLAGVHYAHELKDFDGSPLRVVHRDMSPQNVFITYEGAVKILDFGIAKASTNSGHTQDGIIKGKLAYMAPEQALAEAGPRSDIFSVGVILWELVARKRLFNGELIKVLNELANFKAPPLSSVVENVSPRLEAIVARSLERRPDDRYATADEMRNDLEEFIQASGEQVRLRAVGQALAEAFDTSRNALKEHIKEAMTAPGASPGSLPDLATFVAPVSLQTPQGDGSGSRSRVRPPEAGYTATGRAVASWSPQTGRQTQRARLIALVAGGTVLALAVVRFVAGVVQPSAKPAAAAEARPVGNQPGVSVTSDPPGAIVDWNGQPVGRTPVRLQLPPGPQTLVISKEGFEREVVVTEARADVEISEAVSLRPTRPTPLPTPPEVAPAPPKAAVRTPNVPKKNASAVVSAAPPPATASAPVRSAIRVITDEP